MDRIEQLEQEIAALPEGYIFKKNDCQENTILQAMDGKQKDPQRIHP